MNDTDYKLTFRVIDKVARKAKKKALVYKLETEVPVDLLDSTIRYALDKAQHEINAKQ